MKTRIISACIMLPLLILVYLGGWWLMAAAFAVGIFGIKEMSNAFKTAGITICEPIAFAATVLLYAGNILWPDDRTWLMLWFVAITMASLIYGFNVEKRKPSDSAATVFTLIYVVFFSYHIVLIDQTEYGILIWLVLIAAFGTDIMAYFTGMALGKHKLCPHLSPKKSIEGAIGGTVGGTVLCGIFGLIFVKDMVGMCFIIGAAGSIVAQFGDLSASGLKRQIGIKDYGKLIPGHGGVLDRFDSVLFTAPLVYYITYFVIA